jgi:Na+/H+ antiporter NhaA
MDSARGSIKRGAMRMKISDLAFAVDRGLTVLNHRLLTLLALFMTFGLFCWAMVQGSWIHFAIAGAFGVVIFLPVLVGEKRPEAPHEDPV